MLVQYWLFCIFWNFDLGTKCNKKEQKHWVFSFILILFPEGEETSQLDSISLLS